MPQNRHSSGIKRKKRKGNRRPKTEHLKRWQFQPGESGNPGGRRKNDASAEIARAVFEDNQEAIYKAYLKTLKKGQTKDFTALADRGYGKAPQHISVSGKDEGPIPVNLEGIDQALMKLLSVAEERKAAK